MQSLKLCCQILLDSIESRPQQHFFKRSNGELVDQAVVTLDDIEVCAQFINTARKLMTENQDQIVVEQMARKVLSMQIPSAWKKSLQALETMAFFLKFLASEDLELAYAAFRKCNQGNEEVLELLQEVETMYSEPLLDPQKVGE